MSPACRPLRWEGSNDPYLTKLMKGVTRVPLLHGLLLLQEVVWKDLSVTTGENHNYITQLKWRPYASLPSPSSLQKIAKFDRPTYSASQELATILPFKCTIQLFSVAVKKVLSWSRDTLSTLFLSKAWLQWAPVHRTRTTNSQTLDFDPSLDPSTCTASKFLRPMGNHINLHFHRPHPHWL